MNTELTRVEPDYQHLVIDQEYVVEVRRLEEMSSLALTTMAGDQLFSIHFTNSGPVLRLAGNLKVAVSGDLELNAKKVAIHGENLWN